MKKPPPDVESGGGFFVLQAGCDFVMPDDYGAGGQPSVGGVP